MVRSGPQENKLIEGTIILNSLQTKSTFLTVSAIVVTMLIAILMGGVAIRNIGYENSEQLLMSLCESGEKNLDFYFESVEQAVEMVTAYLEADLESMTGAEQLPDHLERVKDIFSKMTYKTNGVLTYYYRIDPAVSTTCKGFWFININGSGFREHEVTDITLYDTEDTSKLVWFTVPKATGDPVWLPPYVTDNLDVRVISYNAPIYWRGRFLGVVGIEIDYSTMAEQVNHISLYENGYAYIDDPEGRLIYHPHIDVTTMKKQPEVPEGILSDDTFVRYRFEGLDKLAVRLPLKNGMRMNVTVPVSEINVVWQRWIFQISFVSLILLIFFIYATLEYTRHITEPLRELTEVAEKVNQGCYDCRLDYDGDDEVGTLTRAFSTLIKNLEVYISDLNDLAYADALTAVHNKGAFDIYVQNLQKQVQDVEKTTEFAVCIFDCNNLKTINDRYGHDKGNIYIKSASAIICEVFGHSPVFRVGGDEFAAILQGQDYENRDELLRDFDEVCRRKRSEAEEIWEKVEVARGMAVFDSRTDEAVNEVTRRADKLMYENKLMQKNKKGTDKEENNC